MGWRATQDYTRDVAITLAEMYLQKQEQQIVVKDDIDIKQILGKIGLAEESKSPLGVYLTEEEYTRLLHGLKYLSNSQLEDLLFKLDDHYEYNVTDEEE